jgi:hypothetical protein
MRLISTSVPVALAVTLVVVGGCARDRGQPLSNPSQGTTTLTSASKGAAPHCSTGIQANTSSDYGACARDCNRLNRAVPEGVACLSERDDCRTKCAAAFKALP